MRELRDQGLSLRAIADQMKTAGFSISHAGVKNGGREGDRERRGRLRRFDIADEQPVPLRLQCGRLTLSTKRQCY